MEKQGPQVEPICKMCTAVECHLDFYILVLYYLLVACKQKHSLDLLVYVLTLDRPIVGMQSS